MIIQIDDSTLSHKSGKKISTTRVLVQCDTCKSERWGNWSNYKDREGEKHYCMKCLNDQGIVGMKGRKMPESFKKAQSKRMKEKNPMDNVESRTKLRETIKQSYEDGRVGYWYGKKRPEHSEFQKNFLQHVFSTKGEDANFRPELRAKYLKNVRRVSNIQKKIYSSICLHDPNGNWQLEYEINDGVINNVIDIANPDKKIAIEIQGTNFHCDPREFGPLDETFFGKTAQEVWDKDKEKKEWLIGLGWKVFYFWEIDIRKSNFIEDYDWKLLFS